MDSTVILWVLGWAGVLSVVIFVVKGLLDQLLPLIESWRNFLRALRDNEAPPPQQLEAEASEAVTNTTAGDDVAAGTEGSSHPPDIT
ncbi:hypothetical protein OG427_03005 [Streptomyces sp. NBC_00133]|uniref:hypothetical protein n=1 Tax=Streptomyces sp. NBC_00133 TaxID=2903624 RepID=UPI003248E60F